MSNSKLQDNQKACLRLLTELLGPNMEFNEMKDLCVLHKWDIDAIRNVISDFYEQNHSNEQWKKVDRKKPSKNAPQPARPVKKTDVKRKTTPQASKPTQTDSKNTNNNNKKRVTNPKNGSSNNTTTTTNNNNNNNATTKGDGEVTTKNTQHKEKDGQQAKGKRNNHGEVRDKKKSSSAAHTNNKKERKPKEVKPVEPPKPSWAAIVRADIPKPTPPEPEPVAETTTTEASTATEGTENPEGTTTTTTVEKPGKSKKSREYTPKEQPLRGDWAKKNGVDDPAEVKPVVVIDATVTVEDSTPAPESTEQNQQAAEQPQYVAPTVIAAKVVAVEPAPVAAVTAAVVPTPEPVAVTVTTPEPVAVAVLEAAQPAAPVAKPQPKARQPKPLPPPPQPVVQSAVVFKAQPAAVGTYTFAAPAPSPQIYEAPTQQQEAPQQQQQEAPQQPETQHDQQQQQQRVMEDMPVSQRVLPPHLQQPPIVDSHMPPPHHHQPPPGHVDPHLVHQPPMHPHAVYDEKAVVYEDPYGYGGDESGNRRAHRNRPQMQPIYFPVYYPYPAPPVEERPGSIIKRSQGQQGQGPNQQKAQLSPPSGPQMSSQPQQPYNAQYTKKGQYQYNNYHQPRPSVGQPGKSMNKQIHNYNNYNNYPQRGMNYPYVYPPYSYDGQFFHNPMPHGVPHPPQEAEYPPQHQAPINPEEQRYTFN